MKICPRCKTETPDTNFYKLKSGCLSTYCIECHKQMSSDAYAQRRQHEHVAWFGFTRAEYKLGVRKYSGSKNPHTNATVSPCHLAEARAMLAGKNTRGKNRCVKLPGDEEYDAEDRL